MPSVGPIPRTVGRFPCLDFVNSRLSDHLGRGGVEDRLTSPEWRRWFLQRWDLMPVAGEPPLHQLAEARETLRRVLEDCVAGRPLGRGDLGRLNAWLAGAPVRRRFDGGLEPVRRNWAWVLAEVIASAGRLLAAGDRRRLKVCANPACSWIFWDESRNVAGRWCDPTSCGNLIKVREFRRRRRAKIPQAKPVASRRSLRAPTPGGST